MITLREATEDDAPVLAKLNSAFNGVRRSPADIQRAMPAVPSVEITELYVVPAYRGRGAGWALVDAAVRRARDAGASEVMVRTNARNSAAQRLCARLGLREAPELVFRRVFPGAA